MTDIRLFYVTCADTAEAERIASALLERKLIACANILPQMRSLYHWQGELCRSEECVLLLKSTADCSDEIIAAVQELHSYDTPCVLALPIEAGAPDFLQWIADSVQTKKR